MFALTLLAAVAIAVPLAPTPPPSAQPDRPGDPALVAAQFRVTLITGDRVTVTPGDSPTVAVEPAERPDGRPVRFTTRSGETIAGSRDMYVIPSDADAAIGSGALDLELFNVTGLAREGQDRLDTLPLIVRGAVPGVRTARALPTIGASAVRVDRADAAAFWGTARPELGRAVARVSLDHRRRLSLDVSVPRIGAPEAWRSGHDGTGVTVAVIDSGVDATHPDLAGRVVAERNFTEDPDATDGLGHGTHVAATIAGSGAASGGRYKGVAPGAKLVNAKACGADGFCFDSALLPAMDYAARSGAKVINMSLGGGVSDGTDPLSLEVNRLTEQTGALFVIAAGNSGDSAVTVGSPGAASSALTVGAVDKSDRMAGFSSRGPRFGDAAVKPELTAPGVSIVAARATGTALGAPVDEHYTAASGTSMATPHVAGAAAILAGQHSSWTPAQLKGALVSTARPIDAGVTETGAGRVDVAKASASTVFGPGTVDFGRMAPAGGKVRTVSYTNDGDRPVLLRLTASGVGFNGEPIADGGLRVVPSLIYVPGRGRASAFVVANAGRSGTGAFAAIVTATGTGGARVRTPVSYYVTTPTVPLTMTVLDHDGRPTRPNVDRIWILRDDFDLAGNNDPFATVWFTPTWRETTASAQVPAGTYTLLTELYDNGLTRNQATSITRTDVAVRRPTSITLDARRTVPATLRTREPTDVRYQMHMFGRRLPYAVISWGYVGFENFPMYVSPTPPARRGALVYQHAANLAEHLVDLTAFGRPLGARFDPAAIASRWTGEHTVPLVDAGRGTAEEFAAIDVRDKLALVGVVVPPDSTNPWFDAYLAASAAATEAANAGAAALLVYADVPGGLPLVNLDGRRLPVIAIGQADGVALRSGATVGIRAKAAPSFIYNVHYSVANGVEADQHRIVDRNALIRVDSRYHADVPGLTLSRFWLPFRRGAPASSVVRATTMPAPAEVAEYVGGGAGALDEVDWTRMAFLRDGKGNSLGMWQRTAFTPTEDWFAGPITPGSSDPRFTSFSRIGLPGDRDWLVPSAYIGDSAPGHLLDVNAGRIALSRWTLSRDGVPIRPDPAIPSPLVPFFPVPAESAVYRLDAATVLPPTSTFTPSLAVRSMSPRVDTSWTFHSPGRAVDPCPGNDQLVCATQSLLLLGYDLGVDLTNRARPGPHGVGIRVYTSDTGAAVSPARLAVSYSTDEGASWQAASVVDGRAQVINPSGGFVWLRVEAADDAGNTVAQTVQRAYGIA